MESLLQQSQLQEFDTARTLRHVRGTCIQGSSDAIKEGFSTSVARSVERMEQLRREAELDAQLALVQTRRVEGGSSAQCCIYSEQGLKGLNQDTVVSWEVTFCGVFDGHGPYGHLVAKRVRDSLPSYLAEAWGVLSPAAAEAPLGDTKPEHVAAAAGSPAAPASAGQAAAPRPPLHTSLHSSENGTAPLERVGSVDSDLDGSVRGGKKYAQTALPRGASVSTLSSGTPLGSDSDLDGSVRNGRALAYSTSNGVLASDLDSDLEGSVRGGRQRGAKLSLLEVATSEGTDIEVSLDVRANDVVQEAGDTIRGAKGFMEFAKADAGEDRGEKEGEESVRSGREGRASVELGGDEGWRKARRLSESAGGAGKGAGYMEKVEAWKEALADAFDRTDGDIVSHPNFDAFVSGSAAVTVVLQGRHLIVGNLGDSRCVIASSGSDAGSIVGRALTFDHKCSRTNEKKRIVATGARVFALEDEPNTTRVWLPDELMPGLAMSRAFGDSVLKPYGLISEPEVHHKILKAKDKFVILASDGIWDVLSDQEAAEVVARAPARSDAAKALVDAAIRAWAFKKPGAKRDDATVALLFFSTETIKREEDRERKRGAGEKAGPGAADEHSAAPAAAAGAAVASPKGVFESLSAAESEKRKSGEYARGGGGAGAGGLESESDGVVEAAAAGDVMKVKRQAVLSASGLRFEKNDSIGNLVQLAQREEEKAEAATR
eukprot:jgi/Mesen1/5225/ME000026S04526